MSNAWSWFIILGTAASLIACFWVVAYANKQRASEEEIAESESSSTIKQFYDPVWFSRGEGWSGTTWQESNDFCATEKSMALCPSQAVCPVSWLCACWFIYILYCFLNANSSLFCF